MHASSSPACIHMQDNRDRRDQARSVGRGSNCPWLSTIVHAQAFCSATLVCSASISACLPHKCELAAERGTSHIARHSRDRTPTRHQSSDRRHHRERDSDPRQDASGQRHAFHTESNSRGQQHAFHTESSSRGPTEPEQHDRYQARTDPSKSYQEQLQGQHRQYHERHGDRSSNRDRTAFRLSILTCVFCWALTLIAGRQVV